jgi:hypothetical protein
MTLSPPSALTVSSTAGWTASFVHSVIPSTGLALSEESEDVLPEQAARVRARAARVAAAAERRMGFLPRVAVPDSGRTLSA